MLRKPQILLHANMTGGGNEIIATPGEGNRIVIVALVSTATGSVREGSAVGDVVCYVDDQGWAEWNIALGFNQSLHTDAATGGNITVSYYIDSRTHLF